MHIYTHDLKIIMTFYLYFEFETINFKKRLCNYCFGQFMLILFSFYLLGLFRQNKVKKVENILELKKFIFMLKSYQIN